MSPRVNLTYFHKALWLLPASEERPNSSGFGGNPYYPLSSIPHEHAHCHPAGGRLEGRPVDCLQTAASACLQYFLATLKLLKKEHGPTPCLNELCISRLWTCCLHHTLFVPLAFPCCMDALDGTPFCIRFLRLAWKPRCLH